MGTERFDTAEQALHYYESQAPVLTPEFVAHIPWREVKRTALARPWIDVLVYMRNVEKFTDIYYDQLMKSPSGQDPVIGQFMQRWKREEDQHAELLQRFLQELGAVEPSASWYQKLRARIPSSYFLKKRILFAITDLFGKQFIGTHMAWGAINEFSTLQGYHRLARLCGHPVLAQLLRAIATEESRHALFYYHIAQIKLRSSRLAQRLAHVALRYFWGPVGQGLMAPHDTRTVIGTLFGAPDGILEFDQLVTRRIRTLAGLGNLNRITERIAQLAPRTAVPVA